MKASEFIEKLEGVFEHSPWVAAQTEPHRPFVSFQSLYNKMAEIVENASEKVKLSLIKIHPNLGTKAKIADFSQKEQKNAGLNELTEAEYNRLMLLNQEYMNKFGFPFVMAVRGKTKQDIFISIKERLKNNYTTEFEQALEEIKKIAMFRLQDIIDEGEMISMTNYKERVINYGKGDVFAYRTYLKPLTGVRTIPESSFSGRNNIIFGVNVKIAVGGAKLLTSFTEGDNSLVVATDSMKNYIQRHLASYTGTTIEGFLKYTASSFLKKYSHIETISLIGEEIPFETTLALNNGNITDSDLVFKRSRNEYSFATLNMVRRENDRIDIIDQYSGISGLKLIKVSGNSFVGFIRDEYTTLPEDENRPLFVYLNIKWRYKNIEDSFGDNPINYVAAEQIRDIATSVFHQTETPSIQNLIYLIGCRILERFPQLQEVNFESQNHTWDKIVEEIPGSKGKVYTEPRPPYGFQCFTVTQEDVQHKKVPMISAEIQ
ncbi:urate oxidase [Bacillus methanolicus PB1]|uniref:Urate oxidase n=2 Tax=Bacillus methanolicus TaxID=1471 RepID=I3E1R0_BACMT|nr:urate oxidase [Bacillus methanolicus PB1]